MFYKLSLFLCIYLVIRNFSLDIAEPKCHVDKAVDSLRSSLNATGSNESTIIKILTTCSNQQRLEIAAKYDKACSRKLLKDLKTYLSGSFREAVLAMMDPRPLYFAKELNAAIINDDLSTIIEILIPQTNKEMNLTKFTYKATFKRNLSKELLNKKWQGIGHLLNALTGATRNESTLVNLAKAEVDARTLIAKSTAEAWAAIIGSESWTQLRATFDRYKAITATPVYDSVRQNMTEPLRQACIDIVHYITDAPGYFAMRIFEAMSSPKIDEKSLTRVIVTRSEIDLKNVVDSYKSQYEKKLDDQILNKQCGNYCELMHAILQSVHININPNKLILV